MRRFCFHLGTLVILVLILGVGFAALHESNETWDSITFSITLGVLLTSILLAFHRTEKRRAFWVGFALFGSAYLGLSLLPSIQRRLITTLALASLDSKMPRSIPASDALYDLVVVNNSQPVSLSVKKGNGTLKEMTVVAGSNANILVKAPLTRSIGNKDDFVRIGHSFIALIAAIQGGLLSRHLHAKNRGKTSEPSSPETQLEPAKHLSGPSQ